MPNKAHRAAARQAQLRRSKRRRGKGRAQEFDPGPSESSTAAAVQDRITEEFGEPEPDQEVVVPKPRTMRRSRQAAQAGPLPTNTFLGAEIKQIGIITTLILTIIVVLTFVLR